MNTLTQIIDHYEKYYEQLSNEQGNPDSGYNRRHDENIQNDKGREILSKIKEVMLSDYYKSRLEDIENFIQMSGKEGEIKS